MVYNALTKEGIPNAVIHVRNITDHNAYDIEHDITSGIFSNPQMI